MIYCVVPPEAEELAREVESLLDGRVSVRVVHDRRGGPTDRRQVGDRRRGRRPFTRLPRVRLERRSIERRAPQRPVNPPSDVIRALGPLLGRVRFVRPADGWDIHRRDAEDAVLALSAGRGSREDYSRLCEAHLDTVYAALLVALADPEAAEEAATQVFVQAHAALSGFDPEARSFRAWLARHAWGQAAAGPHRVEHSAIHGSGPGEPILDAGVVAGLLALDRDRRALLAIRFALALGSEETAYASGLGVAEASALEHDALVELQAVLSRAA